MKKRFLSILTALALCLSLLPGTALAVEPTEALAECPFTIKKQDGTDATAGESGDYIWEAQATDGGGNTYAANRLTIKTSENLTIKNKPEHSSATATIVAGKDTNDQQIDLNLTLAGVNITAPDNYGALNTTGELTITLADGTTNTLTGGSMTDNASSSYGIYAAGALSISGGGTLHAVGGAVSDSTPYSAGIFSATSITINGGTVEATGASSGSSSYGIYANAGEGTASITINSGNVTAKGGGTSGLGIGGSATFSTGTNGTAIIHVSSFGNSITKNESELSGIIFVRKTDGSTGYDGKVYGDLTLEKDFTNKAGEFLTIPEGTTLTLGENVTLDNKGRIFNNGTIDATRGKLEGNTPEGGLILPLPDVWVGGVQVTTANQDDVLGETDTGATVKYDPATNTLTLNGATITTTSTVDNAVAGIQATGRLRIVVMGANTVTTTATDKDCYGIYTTGKLTISGDGTLHVAATASGSGNGYGLYTTGEVGDIAINDGNGSARGSTQAMNVMPGFPGGVEHHGGTGAKSWLWGDVTGYAVTYIANEATSGTQPFDRSGYRPNTEVTVMGNTGNLAKTGYTFGGWNTQADGNGTNYAEGAAFTITENTTLYAKWTENSTPNTPVTGVTLNKNETTLTVGGTETLTATVAPADATNQAVTWSSNNEAVATVNNGLVTAVGVGTATITVTTADGGKTAQCVVAVTAPTYTVTFDGNRGSVSPTTMTTGADGKLTSLPTASRSNYTFLGWFTAASGGDPVTTDTEFNANTTVYAHWSYNGSSGGDWGGGSSGGSSSSDKETVKNPDGSTTTTEEKKDGTVIEKTERPDGSTTVIETKPDGSSTEETKRPDGSTTVIEKQPDGTTTTTDTDKEGNKTEVVEKPDGSMTTTVEMKDGTVTITVVDPDGKVLAEVALTEKALEGKEVVEIPMPALPSSTDRETAPTVTLGVPDGVTVKVEIPVEAPRPGTVAILVNEDGSKEIVRTSVATDSGVVLNVEGITTVKIVDNSKDFIDVPAHNWAADAVDFVSARELFNGTSATTFAPDLPMSRAMLAKVLHNLENNPDAGLNGIFPDVDNGAWYAEAVSWAADKGIVSGYPDGSFGANDSISREQLAVMLWRYAGSPDPRGSLGAFPDGNDASGYAVTALRWAVGEGIIGGTDQGTLMPGAQATRAQVAAMLMRFCENIE